MRFEVLDIGLTDFKKTCDLQKNILGQIKDKTRPSTLILCRHHPVITAGRAYKEANLKISEPDLKKAGIALYRIERGGDVTYHGPGQIIAYPVFDLTHFKKDIHLYLRNLEEVVLDFLLGLGIKASRRKGSTGVWIGERKIASIGITIKHWISMHGLSINVKKEDLGNFSLMRPCGMDIEMTSIESALGRSIFMGRTKNGLIKSFNDIFGKKIYNSVSRRNTKPEVPDDQNSLT